MEHCDVTVSLRVQLRHRGQGRGRVGVTVFGTSRYYVVSKKDSFNIKIIYLVVTLKTDMIGQGILPGTRM